MKLQIEREIPNMCCFLHIVSAGHQSCFSLCEKLKPCSLLWVMDSLSNQAKLQSASLVVRNHQTKSITLELEIQKPILMTSRFCWMWSATSHGPSGRWLWGYVDTTLFVNVWIIYIDINVDTIRIYSSILIFYAR